MAEGWGEAAAACSCLSWLDARALSSASEVPNFLALLTLAASEVVYEETEEVAEDELLLLESVSVSESVSEQVVMDADVIEMSNLPERERLALDGHSAIQRNISMDEIYLPFPIGTVVPVGVDIL